MALTLENESADNSSSTVSDSSSRSSTMHDMAVSSSGDGVDLSRRSMTRSDDEPQRSAVQPLKSTRASSAGEFKARIEMGKQRILISLPVKVNFNEFVRAVLHSTFVNLTEEDIKRMLHYIDNEGDVVKVPTDENFEEMKVDYFRSGPDWRDLAPLRVVLVQDNIDPLSLVMIPPHHQCPEPMPWKQGKLLGQGAYGSVHMGMKGDGTMLAVKRLDLSSDKGRHISDTYETEKSLLQRLRHTNVVKYVASKKISSSLAVIWMEYVPGGSVASILQAFGPMSEDIVRNYTRQIVQGLIYLHQHSVIHRDLKPGNILVTVSGIVKLSDFGSSLHVTSDQACASQSEDRTRGGGIGGGGGVVGTPNYIAPEVVRARTAAAYSFIRHHGHRDGHGRDAVSRVFEPDGTYLEHRQAQQSQTLGSEPPKAARRHVRRGQAFHRPVPRTRSHHAPAGPRTAEPRVRGAGRGTGQSVSSSSLSRRRQGQESLAQANQQRRELQELQRRGQGRRV